MSLVDYASSDEEKEEVIEEQREITVIPNDAPSNLPNHQENRPRNR